MTPQKRLYTAMSGEKPDRIPTMPKIWIDLACRLMHREIAEIIQNPEAAMRLIIEAAISVKADSARLFHFPPRQIVREGNDFFETDGQRLIGKLDLQGGLATLREPGFEIDISDPANIPFIQFCHQKTSHIQTETDVVRLAVPDKQFYEARFGQIQRNVIAEFTDKIALVGNCGSATLAFCVQLRGLQQVMFDLIDQPRMIHQIMEKGVEIAAEKGKFNIDTGLKILRINDSVGNASVISPANWREFIFPHLQNLCSELHRYDPEVRLYCHICGNTMPLLEGIAEAGIDCIGPLDPLGGCNLAQARRIVGNRAALLGGVDTLSFINKNPEEILVEMQQCIEAAGSRGGFVLGSGCALPRQSRRENLLALHTAVSRFRPGHSKNEQLQHEFQKEELTTFSGKDT